MHAGTPSAHASHALLCAALALVKALRTTARAFGHGASATTATARGLAASGVVIACAHAYGTLALANADEVRQRAPGTVKHYVWALVPSCAMYVCAMWASGRVNRSGRGTALAALALGAALGRRTGSTCALVLGGVATRIGGGDVGVFVMCLAFAIARRLAREVGEEVYFRHWGGTAACEAVALAMTEFDVFASSRARARALERRRELVARIKKVG